LTATALFAALAAHGSSRLFVVALLVILACGGSVSAQTTEQSSSTSTVDSFATTVGTVTTLPMMTESLLSTTKMTFSLSSSSSSNEETMTTTTMTTMPTTSMTTLTTMSTTTTTTTTTICSQFDKVRLALPGSLDDLTLLGVVVAARFGYFIEHCLDVEFIELSSGLSNWDGSLDLLSSDDADLALSDAISLLDRVSRQRPPTIVGLLQLFQKSTFVGVSVNKVVSSFDKIAVGIKKNIIFFLMFIFLYFKKIF
jgi:hypothetical protein